MLKMKFLVSTLALILCVSVTSIRADVVIVQENFDGLASDSLTTSTPLTSPSNWVAGAGFFDDGSIDLSANRLAFLNLGSVINDAVGTPDGLFELEATVGQLGGTGNRFLSVGFGTTATPNLNANFLASNIGVASTILRGGAGEIDTFSGNGFNGNGTTPNAGANTLQGPGSTTGDQTLTIQLDLRNVTSSFFGTATYFANGVEYGSFDFTDAAVPITQASNPNFGELGNQPSQPNFSSIIISGNFNTSDASISNLTLTQIVAVPEPGSLALLGLGSVVMLARRRKN